MEMSFQLIRFKPIGREGQKLRAEVIKRFQLIRFKPIGREFAAEPISQKGFRRQIDAPAKCSTERPQKQ